MARGSIAIRQPLEDGDVSTDSWHILGVRGAVTFLGALTIGPFVAPVRVSPLFAALRMQKVHGSKP